MTDKLRAVPQDPALPESLNARVEALNDMIFRTIGGASTAHGFDAGEVGCSVVSVCIRWMIAAHNGDLAAARKTIDGLLDDYFAQAAREGETVQ